MSNAMRSSKSILAGVAAGALALGALTIATAPAASAKPNVKPKTVTALAAGSFVAAATAYRAPTGAANQFNLMNLVAVSGDDTLGTSGVGSQYVVSIRLDSAPADDTGTGFAAIQLSDDSANPTVGKALAFTADDSLVSTPTVTIPNNYVWTRGSVVTIQNTSLLASKLVLRGTAPNAGTYGFTAWVNATGSDLTTLEPGEPYTTGTITVGGTPTAFAVTPASASVGAGQSASFAVTATDSAGRRTFPTGNPNTPAGSFANVIATPTGVTFTPAVTPPAAGLTSGLGAAQFINLNSATVAQGTAAFTASSVTAGNYAISITPGGTLPGTVTPASATLSVAPVVNVASALVTAPATATTSATLFTPPTTVLTSGNINPIYLPTSATSATFRVQAAAGTTAGQLIPYTVINGGANASGTGVASGSFTTAVNADGRASVTLTAVAPVAGTTYLVSFGESPNIVTYQVTYAAPVLNIGNLTTEPPLLSASYVKTATAKAILADVTDQFGQPLQNITVSASPSVSAASSAITDAKGKASVSIAAPASTVTSQTVTFRLTAPLGSPTPASSALTLIYTASGSPSSLTVSSLAGNVASTATVIQNVDVTGAAAGTWAANGNTGWFPVYATIGGGTPGVPVTFSAKDAFFSAAPVASLALAYPDASSGIVSQAGGIATVYVKPTKTGTVTVTATAGDLSQAITWRVANTNADARVIEVTPAKQDAAGLGQVTASVKDVFGNAVANAPLNFSEEGVGNFLAGTSTLSTSTGPNGSVTVDVLSTTSGDSVVTVIAGATADYAGVAGSPLATSPAGKASGTAEIKFGNGRSITITGTRTTVSGKPGIKISGAVTGIANGKTVVPYFRFPGETTFAQGSARPVIEGGKFTWERKTGKKFYAYVTSDDGAVTSNRVVIAAN